MDKLPSAECYALLGGFPTTFGIRAVTGQRSSPDLCFATKTVKIYFQSP